jgi:hypothetical protein
MGTVWALCECSLLVSQQNNTELSITAQNNTQPKMYKMEGTFGERKVSKSANTDLNDQLASRFHQQRVQMIHLIRAALEVKLSGAILVTSSN